MFSLTFKKFFDMYNRKYMREKVLNLRKEGKTINEICNILGIKKGTVGYYLKNTNARNHVYLKDLSEEEKQNIVNFYIECKNLKKTHEIYSSLSKDTIRRLLIENNVYLGGKRESPRETSRRKSLSVINWKKQKKLDLIEYKGGCCEVCGYNKCSAALEFHHKDPKGKDFAISSHSYSFEKMKKEVDKCMLVCSNCHREIHYM